jgi:chemosensory pili system protein ChpA (sensor histidine kinase/response regulator)
MKTRLVPIATITPRLQRALRQTCRLTGKHSELSVIGDSLMIDSDMLNSLVDPLMHLLRNAVDHGIEIADNRLAVGKSAQGKIAIQFERDGNNIVVVCRDDGRGLDFAAIRVAAEKRGVITPDQEVSEDELKRFILRPNFTTRSQTTQTSGRGVGMDAVYFQVVNLGGSLVLDSKLGQGLTVELRMPLPLSRSHALIANAGPYRVAIATKGIKQVFYSTVGIFFYGEDGQKMLKLEDEAYPVQTLNSLLNIPKSAKAEQENGAVLLVQHNDGITAVLLDALTDGIDIVIKNFGHYLKKIPGFMGAAIMGDGLVAPVLDIPELLRTSASLRDGLMIEDIDTFEPEMDLPTIMVVDDSLSQRRSLELLLQDAGFHVITARDGIEAVNMLQKTKPDLVLTDLEMPRMNGIELTAHIRTNAAVKSVPVIMITSRTTQKHHKMAEDAGVNFYLVKPVREDDLLAKMQVLMEKSLAVSV